MNYDFVVNEDHPHKGGNLWQGDPWTFAPRVWRYMVDRFAIRSVLDVGSGRGHAAAWFYKHGCATVAIDAEDQNVASAFYPTVMHDITLAPFTCLVDLVHCQEVVEHIDPSHINNLMMTLCNGDAIVMSHGEPGQVGHHHVNLQPASYWIEQMGQRGFALLDDDTIRVRKLAEGEAAHHLARSGLVFGRKMARQA